MDPISQRHVEDIRSFKAKKLHNLRIEYAVKALESRESFLEVGCGEGFCTRSIAHWSKKPFRRIEGFDLDAIRIARAQSLWSDDGRIRYRVSDAGKPFPYRDGEFDAVVLLDILEHVPAPEYILRESLRVLKKGGIFFLVVPCEGEPGTLHSLLHRRRWKGSEKYGGHIQQFRKKDIADQLEGMGLERRWARYSCHWIGQLTDVAGYEIKRLADLKAGQSLTRGEGIKFYLLKKAMKTFLQKLSYGESAVLARVGAGAMDLNICFQKT